MHFWAFCTLYFFRALSKRQFSLKNQGFEKGSFCGVDDFAQKWVKLANILFQPSLTHLLSSIFQRFIPAPPSLHASIRITRLFSEFFSELFSKPCAEPSSRLLPQPRSKFFQSPTLVSYKPRNSRTNVPIMPILVMHTSRIFLTPRKTQNEPVLRRQFLDFLGNFRILYVQFFKSTQING